MNESAASTATPLMTEGRAAGLSRRAADLLARAGRAIDRRDLGETDQLLTAAIALAPEHPEVLRLLGVAYLLAERPGDAVATLRRALVARPGDALILNNLGSALRGNGEPEAAIATFREACARAPTLAAAWYNLAKTLKAQAYSEEARDALEHALRLAPHHVAARTTYANVLRSLGRIDEALQQYRRVLRHQPDAANAWLGLTNVKTVQLSHDETRKLQACYDRLDLEDEDRASLGFALATALEYQGRYEEAFIAFEKANASRARQVPWDRDEFSRCVDATLAAFASPGEDPEADCRRGHEVLFIVSLPRSGSTLTEQIISAHPDVEGAGELPDMQAVLDEESSRRKAKFPLWVPDATEEDWRRLGLAYLERTRRWRANRPYFTDKALSNWQHIGAIARMLPGARFIDCRRNPVETCLSCWRQWFGHGQGFSYDLDALAAYWHDYVRLMAHWSALWPGRIHRQIYEELVADPGTRIRRLLEACGLPFDPACLEFHRNARPVRTASAAQVREPLRLDTARAARYGALLDPLRRALGIPFRGS
jgi:tetratricopeptide (TPR) repeat protein